MVFKRRDKPPFFSRIREIIYPQKGWRRGIEYLSHRVRRLPDTAHRISLGVSCGVFASFTPLFGLHFIVSAALARIFRANILAALIGTAFGNPLTFPFIASISMGTGRKIVGLGPADSSFSHLTDSFKRFLGGLWDSFLSLFGYGEAHWGALINFLKYVVWPYFVGGLIPGLIAGTTCYLLCRPLVEAYQIRRKAKLAERSHANAAKKARSRTDAPKKKPYISPNKTAAN
ncbi:MAG: DUF2062 domain-containing protein [Pseudomonadota bacterium]